jgi:hypothetical protein
MASLILNSPAPCNLNVSEFIDQFYDVKFKGQQVPEHNFNSVEEFLLAEKHDALGYDVINSLFINTFSKPQDVVLVESVYSMKKIDKEEALQSICLTTNTSIMGWDTRFYESTDGFQFHMKIFLRDYLNPNYIGDKDALKNNMASFINDYEIPHDNSSSKEIYEKIAEDFPLRTVSMVESLQKAKNIATHTFLIAGYWHLQNELKDSRFSLDKLYADIKDRDLMILFPKISKVEEMGRQKDELYFDMTAPLRQRMRYL